MPDYQPNFKDPRVLGRMRHAYGFARAVLGTTPHNWSTRYIDRYFGHQGNNLSQWLRRRLLTCTSDRYSQDRGECKEYRLNQAGADYIRNILQGHDADYTPTEFQQEFANITNHQFDQEVVQAFALRAWGPELASKNFTYEDKSLRLWHPLQNVRKQQRERIFADHGLCYQYDIVAAAPTLIHQHAQQQQVPMDLYLFALRRYLQDRQAVRVQIAQELEIDIKAAKVLVNAMFCGAKIGLGPDRAISQLLAHDQAKVQWLKENKYIQELKADIRTCWQYIQPSMMRRSIIDKNNKSRLLAITSREKWQRYFQLERTCIMAIRSYLVETNNDYFLEHDGWSCIKSVDLEQLASYVYQSTGFQLNFEVKKIFTGIKKRQEMESLIN